MPDLCSCLPDDYIAGRGCSAIPMLFASVESLADCLCSASCEFDKIQGTTQTAMGTTAPTDNQLDLLFVNCVDCTDLANRMAYLIANDGGIHLFFYDVANCTWIAVDTEGTFQNDFRTQSTGFITNTQTGNTAGLVIKLGPTVMWNATTFAPAVGDLLQVNLWWGYRIDQFSDAVNPVDSVEFQLQFTGAFTHTINLGIGAQPPFRNGLEAANFSVARQVTTAGTDLSLTILADMTGTAPTGPTDWIWSIYHRQSNSALSRIAHV